MPAKAPNLKAKIPPNKETLVITTSHQLTQQNAWRAWTTGRLVTHYDMLWTITNCKVIAQRYTYETMKITLELQGPASEQSQAQEQSQPHLQETL